MNVGTIILDLDGPILEGRVRHYRCYEQILRSLGYEPLDMNSYWRIKCEPRPLHQLLALSNAEEVYREFLETWLESIEMPSLLALDQLQEGAIEKLHQWRDEGMELVVVSQRRCADYLHSQLENLNLEAAFDHVLVSKHIDGGSGKVEQIRNAFPGLSASRCLWVGDTEVDVEAARLFGCPIWAVTCGVRSESYLASLSPDFLVPNLTHVDVAYAFR